MIGRHYPRCADEQSPYLALLREVVSSQAALIARWMHVGFIHGVMNTDNMAVSGETIDFGPCAFMDAFDPASGVQLHRRSAAAMLSPISRTPRCGTWLALRKHCCLSWMPMSQRAIGAATEAIATFETLFKDRWLEGMRRKLGLSAAEQGDRQLAEDLLQSMQRNQADFTVTFRALCDAAHNHGDGAIGDAEWMQRWRARHEPRIGAPQ